MRPLWIFLLAIAVTVPCGWYAWCNLDSALANAKETRQDVRTIVRPVPTEAAKPLARVTVREFPGTVRAEQRVDLAFSVSGQLLYLNADEGERVRKGEVVARLDQRDFAIALDKATAAFEEARKTLKRTETLIKQNVVTQSDLDGDQATYDSTRAEVRSKKKALDDTEIYAPFDGVIAKRYVENHEHITAKSPIVSIQDISVIQVVFEVPERTIAKEGNLDAFDINVEFDVLEGKWFKAKPREVEVEADDATHTYDVVVNITPQPGMHIYPGMTATVRVGRKDTRASADNVPDAATLVPVQAVFADSDGKACVWVINGVKTEPVKTPVTLGRLRDDGQEILSGLTVGQQVAVAGVHTLTENMRVRAMTPGVEGLD